jgi:hypothetical protein
MSRRARGFIAASCHASASSDQPQPGAALTRHEPLAESVRQPAGVLMRGKSAGSYIRRVDGPATGISSMRPIGLAPPSTVLTVPGAPPSHKRA